MKRPCRSIGGFTLIEVIVTLTITAILGVVVYQYLGSSFLKSSEPYFRLGKAFSLRRIAENMTADYLHNYTANLPGLSAKIANPQSSKYGDCTVVENKYIRFNATTNAEENETDPTKQKLLKVTIKNDQGETITMVFVSP
ncbi:MAG: prepilin-type N-terminal cleavage/methylation domain-containing protein [Smithellaceae bacterium]|nr:prepilin-type N-terminal cleavage/methylation domain-containing protein [Smithellaceae bacterium]